MCISGKDLTEPFLKIVTMAAIAERAATLLAEVRAKKRINRMIRVNRVFVVRHSEFLEVAWGGRVKSERGGFKIEEIEGEIEIRRSFGEFREGRRERERE